MRTLTVVLALTALMLLVGCDQGGGNVLVEAESLTVSNAPVKAYAQASGGKAVLMDKDTSKLEGTVDLKAGKFKVIVTGMAPDGFQDAMDLAVTGVDVAQKVAPVRQRVCFDEQFNAFVAASSEPAPEITLAQPGKVKVALTIDDETGMCVDKVEFQPVVAAK